MTVFQTISYALTIIPFLWIFRSENFEAWLKEAPPEEIRSEMTLSDATVYLSIAFLVLLFGALAIGGTIPLLAKIERWTFNEQSSGNLLHQFVLKRGDFICFWWGVMFSAEKMRHSRFDYRYILLLMTILIYMFLVGGRFSPFYRYCSFLHCR